MKMKQVVQLMEEMHNASNESEKKSLITSRSINLKGFPQIRDNVGNVIGWSWREIRKWEFSRNR